MQPYRATIDNPLPPADAAWRMVRPDDEPARARASGMLGDLPAWHFHDELLESGLYRFFAFETPVGRAVSALRFAGTLGDGELVDPPPGDNTAGNTDPVHEADPPPAPPKGGGGGGASTNEPIPASDNSCSWVPDASNAQAVAVATNISYHNTPVAWTDQGSYSTTIGGNAWRFVMWFEDGKRMVAAYRCVAKAGGDPTAMVSSSAWPLIIAGAIVMLAIGGVTLASMHHADTHKKAA